MENTKIFAGYVKNVRVWDEATRKFVDAPWSITARFSLSLSELDDLKKYATKGEKPFVSFDMKRSAKGSYYIEVSDPATWPSSNNGNQFAQAAPQAAPAPMPTPTPPTQYAPSNQVVASSDDLPF
jgi:hypothetical protein